MMYMYIGTKEQGPKKRQKKYWKYLWVQHGCQPPIQLLHGSERERVAKERGIPVPKTKNNTTNYIYEKSTASYLYHAFLADESLYWKEPVCQPYPLSMMSHPLIAQDDMTSSTMVIYDIIQQWIRRIYWSLFLVEDNILLN